MMEQQLSPLFQLGPSQIPLKLLSELQITKEQTCNIEEVVTPMMLNLPQSTATMQTICKVFQENLKRVNKFFMETISPLSICQIILDINNIMAENSVNKTTGVSVYQPIFTYSSLKKFIKQAITIQLRIEAARGRQQQAETSESVKGDVKTRATNLSKNRKNWGEPTGAEQKLVSKKDSDSMVANVSSAQ